MQLAIRCVSSGSMESVDGVGTNKYNGLAYYQHTAQSTMYYERVTKTLVMLGAYPRGAKPHWYSPGNKAGNTRTPV